MKQPNIKKNEEYRVMIFMKGEMLAGRGIV